MSELTARPATIAQETVKIEGPEVLNPVMEASKVNTNQADQWSLNAIENLEMASDQIPRQAPETED